MGLMTSEWGHEINQKTFSFESYLLGVRSLIDRLASDRRMSRSRCMKD